MRWVVESLSFVGELVFILITTLKTPFLGLGNNPMRSLGVVEIDPLGPACTLALTHPPRHEFAKQEISTTSPHANH